MGYGVPMQSVLDLVLRPSNQARPSTVCFTSTQVRWLIRDGDRGGGGGGDKRVKARPRIPPEKERRDRGPPPEQWKC